MDFCWWGKGLLEEWEKRISRGNNWKMKSSHTVCELHFDDTYINTTHEINIGDLNISEKREKKTLSDDAVPTIFDGYPSYKNFKVPTKRAPPKQKSVDTVGIQAKRRKQDHENARVDEEMEPLLGNMDDDTSTHSEDTILTCNLPLSLFNYVISDPHVIVRPSVDWHIHKGPQFVSFVHINEEGTQIDRFVKFHENSDQPEVRMINKKILEKIIIQNLEEISHLLKRVDNFVICPGVGCNNLYSDKCLTYLEKGGVKKKTPPRCFQCAEKRKAHSRLLRRQLANKYKGVQKKKKKENRIRCMTKKIISSDRKIMSLRGKVEALANKLAQVKKEKINEYIQNMPVTWQNAILACVEASKAISPQGRRYTTNWVYECLLLRIKSLKLYKKMLRDNFLPLPSLRTLQRYMKRLNPSYGFQANVFALLKEKSPLMKESERHGALLIDEVKLSEGIWFDKHFLKLLGMVNLDQFTPEKQKDVPADHALVMMFQGFQGQYFQTISAHLSKGAVKGQELAKLVLEAIRLTEEAGYFIDVVVGDAASWNRNMWSQFGLKKLQYEKEQSKTRYLTDDNENIDEDFEDGDLDCNLDKTNKGRKPSKKQARAKAKTSQRKSRAATKDVLPEAGLSVNSGSLSQRTRSKKQAQKTGSKDQNVVTINRLPDAAGVSVDSGSLSQRTRSKKPAQKTGRQNVVTPDAGESADTGPQPRRRPSNKQPAQNKGRQKKDASSQEEGLARTASCVHPVDNSRRLWFVSDFPHLVKSMKQRIVNAEELITPDGTVKLKHWYIVCKEDERRGIKVAPSLSIKHFQSESYLAMNVGMAISFFSEEVATAMEHYKRVGVVGLHDCESTVKFIRRINVLIDALNSNTKQESLKAPTVTENIMVNPPVCPECHKTHSENTPRRKKAARQVLEDFLSYLEKWETSGVARDKRLTASAAYGLRVTITTALELSLYLINDLGYEYFMTRRINQDRLEHFFGEIRQGCGAHGHPDPAQFIQVYRLMSFKTLVKPPKGSNVTGGDLLNSLLSLPDHRSIENKKRQIQLERELDDALDIGEIMSLYSSDNTEACALMQIDQAALRMFGGYVARKARRSSYAKDCEECFLSLKLSSDEPVQEDDDIIHSRSKGYLLRPSDALMKILETLEICVLEILQNGHLHTDIVFEVTDRIKGQSFVEVGCEEHRRKLTKAVISFYICTRLIFACEEYNRRTSNSAKSKEKAKQQQKINRLTS